MPSQQGVFPKRSLGRNPKIDHFSPTTKPHPLNLLTEGLPFLYWLGTRGGALALLCAFHYPLHLSSFTPTPFLLFLPCLILLFLPCLILLCVFYVHAYPPWHGGCGLFGLYYFLLFLHGLGHWLGRSPCPCSSLGFCSCYFSSYYAHGPIGYHSCHVSPLNFLPIFLGFHNPFTLLLSLVMPMGLLVVIPAILAHYASYLFSWASKAHLLYLYLLLCIWAYWLLFMPCWTIRLFTFFLGLLRPIYFTFTL